MTSRKATKEEVSTVLGEVKRQFKTNLSQMAAVINQDRYYLSNAKRGTVTMSLEDLESIREHFSVKPLDVLMEQAPEYGKKVPFYETDAFATISPSMQGAIPLNEHTYKYIPFFGDSNLVVMVTGQSMKRYINHGDWVGLKRIFDVDRIIPGECYYIITKANNLKTVKFVKKHDDPEYYWLVPYNIEQFNPFAIEKSDILEMYKVNAIIRSS